jgi:hypothetical protein
MSDRIDRTEKHTATDRISWYGDLRVKADTLHYKDLTYNPGARLSAPISAMFGGVTAVGFDGNPLTAPQKYNRDNDILYTTRLRLGMKAKVADNVGFSGRLSMYKNWGDSTGVKVLDGFTDVTTDGTDGGNTTGDIVRVERAYFDWKDIGGSNFYLSIGRRPSTYGPPTQFRENEMRGGTPSGHLVNFNFDGVTVGYHLSAHTGVEGQTVRFCYGQGFESDYGNGTLTSTEPITRDMHLGGFNVDAINDGTNFLQFTLFEALDVTDGFKGLAVFPSQFYVANGFDPAQASFGLVSRMQPTTNIGNITLGGVGFTREEDNGINWFGSFGWDRTDPNGEVGPFGGLLTDAVIIGFDGLGNPIMGADSDAEKVQNGYSVYVGIQVPAPAGKFGLEYNWGSQYWFNFTQAQDDIIGSKLATRGQVGEAYYIIDINPNMFIKVGGIYYDYEYTGSGAQVGKPHKIEDVQDGLVPSMFPVVDKAIDGYASLTVKF